MRHTGAIGHGARVIAVFPDQQIGGVTGAGLEEMRALAFIPPNTVISGDGCEEPHGKSIR
jgi:hypothetical protein